MTTFVIDTSALLRLYLEDGLLPAALVPDLCLLECASVLRKQVLRGTITSEESMALLADLLLLPLRTVAAVELVCDAFELALRATPSAFMTPPIWPWLCAMAPN